MTYTPPVAGSSSWDVPLNAALAAINADVATVRASGAGTAVATDQTTSSTSYGDLTTAGPSCSVTLTEARTVLVLIKAQVFQGTTTDPVYMSFAASGATTLAAADTRCVRHNGSGTAEAYCAFAPVACSIGTTTFTAKYKAGGGVAHFANREIAAVVL